MVEKAQSYQTLSRYLLIALKVWSKNEYMQLFFTLFKYLKGKRIHIAMATLYTFLAVFFSTLPEFILGFAVDTVIHRQTSFLSVYLSPSPYIQLLFLGVLAIIIYSLESFFQYLYSIKWRTLGQHIQHTLRLDAYRHVQKLETHFFEEQSSGVVLNILVNDINLLEQFFNEGISESIQLFSGFLIFCCTFAYFSVYLLLISLLSIALIFIVTFYFKDKLNSRYAQVREAAGILAGVLSNNLLGMVTIKNYTTEQYELERVAGKSKKYTQANKEAIAINAVLLPLIRMSMLMGYVTMLIVGGVHVLNDQLPIGAYTTLIFLYGLLLWPFARLGGIVDHYQRAMASLSRVFNLIEIPSAAERLNEIPLSTLRGPIVFDNVSFTYPNGLRVLSGVSFEIKPCQTVAFVGPTGSGKSTIVKLLLQHYQSYTGSITIEGKALEIFDQGYVRNHFGVVSQDIFLIDGTIEENIRYGSFDASFDEVVAVAKAVHAYEFIMKMPQQFETEISERGQKLSGGQKQRISLARALLKKPPIFIFDEATSSLDNETEQAIQRSLHMLKQHTSIIIAHRLSTVRRADVIHVLKDGKIIESGNHESLLLANGFYAHLWRLQMGEGEIIKGYGDPFVPHKSFER